MTTLSTSNTDTCRVLIEGELTIYSVAEQKGHLLGQLETCRELELDLSAVSEFDSAGLQLLLLLKREAEQQECLLRLVNHSRAVVEVLELLAMQGHFGDPLLIPAGWSTP